MTTHRPDIDGLRALAVIPVVLFHMDLQAFGGGFTGVDVFFVISGFLITSIIAHDLETPGRRFSLLTFYERRVRRIFPALFTVLAVTAVLAALILLPRDFEAFAKSLVATAAFASNIHFHRQFGYFDTEAHAKPLLHTWSLSVEEQFYLVFPVLMIVLFKWLRVRERVRRVLLLAALASFALATAQVFGGAPEAAFYLAPARAWELLLGSLLALGAVPAFRSRRVAEAAGVTGLLLLAIAFLGFSLDTPFPGPAALIPTLGAALLIHSGCLAAGGRGTAAAARAAAGTAAGAAAAAASSRAVVPSGTMVSRLLSSRPLVAIGLISYSLYLWHWALLSMARHWTLEPLTLLQTTAVVLLSVACSAASWRWIEQPVRGLARKPGAATSSATASATAPAHPSASSAASPAAARPAPVLSRRVVFAAGAALSLATIAAGVAGAVSGGWPGRMDPQVLALDAAQLDFNERRPECHANDKLPIPYRDTCRFGAPAVSPRFAVWGDSHAAELSVALGEFAARTGDAVRMVSYSGCPPALPVDGAARTAGCRAHNGRTLDALRADNDLETVFLIARYAQAQDELGAAYFTHLGGVARALADAGKRVVLVYPSPEYAYTVPVQLARAAHRGTPLDGLGLPRQAFEASREPFTVALDRIRADSRILKVDPAARLCDARRCRIYADGRPLYFDDDHLSMAGARYVVPLFAPFVGQAVASPRGAASDAAVLAAQHP